MKSTTTTGEDDNPTKSHSTTRRNIIVCVILVVVFLMSWVGAGVVFRFNFCGALGRRQWRNHPTTCFASDKIPNKEDSHKKDHHHHYPVCIVGAGLSGSVLAERYASVLGTRVWMIEKRSHIGGNCYDYRDAETGIRVSKYGAHLFHTSHTYVADYIRQFGGPWKDYRHQVRAFVDGQYVPIPVNIETVNTLYGLNMTTTRDMKDWLSQEQTRIIPSRTNNNNHNNTSETVALSRVGRRLYETLFRPYTWKQWNQDPSDLDPSVLARIPVRTDFGLDYFEDPIQMQPLHGFTSVVRDMLRSPLIRVDLNMDFQHVKDQIHKNCDKIYYTGPIDVYFGSLGWPRLEYRSLEFERVVVRNSSTSQTSFYQPHFVVNYPSTEYNFTRIVEYKHLSNALVPRDNSDDKTTVFFKERSIAGGEPFYPVPNARNQALYRRYQEMAAQQADKVTFVGRLANYKYYNMDEAIANALQVFEKDTGILQSTLKSARMNH